MQAHFANAKHKVDANKHRWKKVFQEGDLEMTHLPRNRFPDKVGEAKIWPFSSGKED